MTRTAWMVAGASATLVAALALWLHRPDAGLEDVVETQIPADAQQIERGRYLVTAGDCIACHTAQGRAPYSGDREVPTPFGSLYTTNLTPDPETGLGNWSTADFWRALHFGRSRDGRRLYPAFPYSNYTLITREDADAMFAHLRTLPAVRQPARPPALRFPYRTELALAVWRALYFRPGTFAADASKDAAWNRGAYLVEGLGHCGACHSGRNWLGGVSASQQYAGGPIPMLGWDALPLTSEDVISDAQAAEMARLLKAGTSTRDVMTGPMAEVVLRSLQYLDDADIAAMVTYLRTLPHRAQRETPQLRVPDRERKALLAAGAQIYEKHCADCHGADGQGRADRYPALAGNRLVTAASPANAIEATLFGGYGPSTALVPQPYGMPPYVTQLKSEEIAAVLTYVRSAWGNQASAVAPAAVERH